MALFCRKFLIYAAEDQCCCALRQYDLGDHCSVAGSVTLGPGHLKPVAAHSAGARLHHRYRVPEAVRVIGFIACKWTSASLCSGSCPVPLQLPAN